MDSESSIQTTLKILENIRTWFVQNIFITDTLIQAGILAVIFLFAFIVFVPFRKKLRTRLDHLISGHALLGNLIRESLRLIPYTVSLALIWICIVIATQGNLPKLLLSLTSTLLLAWIIIRLATSVILERLLSRTIALLAWSIAALDILNLLDPTVNFLDGLGFTVGEVRLTALSIIKALILLTFLLKIGTWLSDYLNRRLQTFSDLTPSTSVLISKLIKISLFFVIVLVALSSVGIDLTALAVFSGAIGVGIGFGLQKVVANLISGIILLMDKSIKPGDVIQIGDVYGWISNLQARFVSVITRDGTEYLIPNEDLITQQVINWSYSNKQVRFKVPIGISYKADPRKAKELILEAASDTPRVIKDPPPVCLMKGFGDSSVDLELRFWINDPENGLRNVQSEILFKVWDLFKENNIEIPFPQRDVHLNVQPFSTSLPIRMDQDRGRKGHSSPEGGS